MSERHDITTREDVDLLVRAFYRDAVVDDLLGPYFHDVVPVDLAAHIPKLVDYWETMLFQTGSFGRPAMPAHLALHALEPFHQAHFNRWIELFDAAVDDHFAGPVAEQAKRKARTVLRALRQKTLGHGIALGRLAGP